jgi:hypothetical protein
MSSRRQRAAAKPSASAPSAYELARAHNIARNERKLRELNLHVAAAGMRAARRPKAPPSRGKRKRPPAAAAGRAPPRRSRRTKRLPPETYAPPNADAGRAEAEDRHGEEVRRGWRRAEDGRWRGEVFGPVVGVPVGTVFGSGDYQRAGRFEMSRTGFFQPVVTPEWIDNTTKEVFAIVVNNDNGASHDRGDVIEYAGAGGRYRGQNRTAQQSFHQHWKSATNAALRRNHMSGRPVRVIRGPKCRGPHGTRNSGGGFRYDGLYRVERAELRMGARKLRTAMFTLCRIPNSEQ